MLLFNSFIELFSLNPVTFWEKAAAGLACGSLYVAFMYLLFYLWTLVDKKWSSYEASKKAKELESKVRGD
jgi:hypothetical protein